MIRKKYHDTMLLISAVCPTSTLRSQPLVVLLADYQCCCTGNNDVCMLYDVQAVCKNRWSDIVAWCVLVLDPCPYLCGVAPPSLVLFSGGKYKSKSVRSKFSSQLIISYIYHIRNIVSIRMLVGIFFRLLFSFFLSTHHFYFPAQFVSRGL